MYTGGGHNGPANLFVCYCPETWTDDDIKKEFEPYGTVVSATIMKVIHTFVYIYLICMLTHTHKIYLHI